MSLSESECSNVGSPGVPLPFRHELAVVGPSARLAFFSGSSKRWAFTVPGGDMAEASLSKLEF